MGMVMGNTTKTLTIRMVARTTNIYEEQLGPGHSMIRSDTYLPKTASNDE